MAPPLVWPVVVLVAAILTSGSVWRLVLRYRPSVAATGRFGPFVLFDQALDALSTLVGVDVFSFVERVPASRAALEFADGLPPSAVLGSGWLFVPVKLGLAVALVTLARPEFEFEEPPAQVRALPFVAGVAGLVPGASNLVLLAG